MSTVAYRDGVMAADTQGSGGPVFRAQKLYRIGNSIVGLAGN